MDKANIIVQLFQLFSSTEAHLNLKRSAWFVLTYHPQCGCS